MKVLFVFDHVREPVTEVTLDLCRYSNHAPKMTELKARFQKPIKDANPAANLPSATRRAERTRTLSFSSLHKLPLPVGGILLITPNAFQPLPRNTAFSMLTSIHVDPKPFQSCFQFV